MKFILGSLVGISLLFGAVHTNSTSAKELITLNGIGAKKTEAVVIYRKDHCFKTVDKLVSVKVIAKKAVEKNRDNLTAGKCKK